MLFRMSRSPIIRRKSGIMFAIWIASRTLRLDHTSAAGNLSVSHQVCAANDVANLNVADYARQLMVDFLLAGGTIETRDFHSLRS